MKKLFVLVIVLIAVISGYEYYMRYRPWLEQIRVNLKSGVAVENIKAEIFTPGGLRGDSEFTDAVLTVAGIIEQTNEVRVDLGKQPLKENRLLSKAALDKVKDMFAGQYFEHISPAGRGPANFVQEAGYVYITVGENLALGNYHNDAALVEAWMNSPGHRANILNDKFTEIGVAVLKGKFEGKTTWLAVQEFGRPASDCPRVDPFLKSQIDAGKIELDRLEQQVVEAKRQLEDRPESSTQDEVDAYNRQVAEFNNLVRIFNNRIDTQKSIVNQYNAQVKAFNGCIAKYK